MAQNLSDARKRLLYRAMHRGFKEADLIVGRFAEARLATMTDAEVAEFERLLDVPDTDLFAWVTGRADIPENWRGPVLAELCRFDLASLVRSGRAN
jgi:antitoxin CptB